MSGDDVPATRSRDSALAIALCLVIVQACSEREETLTGFELASGIVDSTQIRAVIVDSSDLDTYFQATRNTGTRFFSGRQFEEGKLAEAKALLRFSVSLPVDAVVLEDTLILNCDLGGDYGNPTSQFVDFARVTSGDWFTDPSLGWPFDDHVPLGVSERLDACEDSVNVRETVLLPPSLITGWIAEPDSNFGIALVAGSGQGWKRFVATGSLAPVIGLRYTVGADTVLARLEMAEHATLYSLDPDIENGQTGDEPFALIGGAYDFRAIVRYDLSFLPESASLHELSMELRLDRDRVIADGDSVVVTIGAHEVIGLPGEILGPRPVVGFAVDPVDRVDVNAGADTTMTFNLSLLGPAVNGGVLLKMDRDYPVLERLGFFTREGPAEFRPRLRVTYSLPARIRL